MDDEAASKWKGLLWLGAACLVGACIAVGVSPLIKAIPWSWEESLSDKPSLLPAEDICVAKLDTQKLLERLVGRIYPVNAEDTNFSITVSIADSTDINAYAGLGGHIIVYSGLLEQAKTPEELAGVLAHEIEHVRHRHVLEGFLIRLLTTEGIKFILGDSSSSRWTNYFLNAHYSRAQEREADTDGLMRLKIAHVDKAGFKTFFERLDEKSTLSDFLSDHPMTHNRMRAVDQFPSYETKPIMSAQEWKNLQGYCDHR